MMPQSGNYGLFTIASIFDQTIFIDFFIDFVNAPYKKLFNSKFQLPFWNRQGEAIAFQILNFKFKFANLFSRYLQINDLRRV